MTTPARAALYELQHLAEWAGKGYASFNPRGVPVEDLPVIYGFNNGGRTGWFDACLIAQDGTLLGGHVCSSEGYMPHDLGILEGSRPDRHEGFQTHYPNGYRMEFVGYDDVLAHAGLQAAFKAHSELPENAQPLSAAEGTKTPSAGEASNEKSNKDSGND